MRVAPSPFRSVPMLFLDPADSEFCAFLQEAHALVERYPALLVAIEADLDRHCLAKKGKRPDLAVTQGRPRFGRRCRALVASSP